MRGRKRLRKKLRAKQKTKTKISISLELGESLPQGASLGVIEQFRNECLKPEGLIFDAKATSLGWDGKIKNTNRSLLGEEHREMIAEWAFMHEEINSYSISPVSAE